MTGEWTLLARSGTDASVSRCPEGHIHVEYGVTTLRLDDRRFLELAQVVCAAARKVGQVAGPLAAVDQGRSGMN